MAGGKILERRGLAAVVVFGALFAACSGDGNASVAPIDKTSAASGVVLNVGAVSTEVATTSSVPVSTTSTTVAPAPAPASVTAPVPALAPKPVVALDADVAAIPDGNGARIAVVIDDVGGSDTYLQNYLELPIPLTLAVIPLTQKATADAELIHAAGKQVIMHIPLQTGSRDGKQSGRLHSTDSPERVEQYVAQAVASVPYAAGANNHQGGYGSSQRGLMRSLLTSLESRDLFFMDSVTTGSTVAFAMQGEVGMDRRINNVFLDHLENDADSRSALLNLAKIAASKGSAIGICHAQHPWQQHALYNAAAQLQAKGYVFAPLSDVTNGPAPGLSAGVRTTL